MVRVRAAEPLKEKPRTLLRDQLNLGDETDIGGRRHRMFEEQPAVFDGRLVAQHDRPTGAQAHPVRRHDQPRTQAHERHSLVVKPIQAQPDARGDDEVALLLLAALLIAVVLRELFERTMQAEV